MTSTNDISQDKRTQRTLTALQQAFDALVTSKPYDEITLNEIISKANVGRSTFYQYYKSKDDILAKRLTWPMSVIASAVSTDANIDDITGTLSHFWDKRSYARIVFNGSTLRHIKLVLAEHLCDHLLKADPTASSLIPHDTYAKMIAEAQMFLVKNWLIGQTPISLNKVTQGLIQVSQAMMRGLNRA